MSYIPRDVPEEMLLMTLLNVRDRGTMKDLLRAIGKSLGMAQRYYDYAEAHGYITRERSENGKTRNRATFLTEAGKKVIRDYGHNSS